MNWWDVFWQVNLVQIVFIVLLIVIIRAVVQGAGHTSRLLSDAQRDRNARAEVLIDLKTSAHNLAEDTKRALDAANAAAKIEHDLRIELKAALDRNTQLIEKTAVETKKAMAIKGEEIASAIKSSHVLIGEAKTAAKEAFVEANNINKKITDLHREIGGKVDKTKKT